MVAREELPVLLKTENIFVRDRDAQPKGFFFAFAFDRFKGGFLWSSDAILCTAAAPFFFFLRAAHVLRGAALPEGAAERA